MYIYIYTYIHMYVYLYIYICVYIYIYISLSQEHGTLILMATEAPAVLSAYFLKSSHCKEAFRRAGPAIVQSAYMQDPSTPNKDGYRHEYTDSNVDTDIDVDIHKCRVIGPVSEGPSTQSLRPLGPKAIP